MKQLPLPIVAPAAARFDTFVVGANAAVLQHLAQLRPQAAPVYLWGPSGSGKTHLLRALAQLRHERGERAGWFDAASRPPWSLAPDAALLLLDDVDAFDDAQQHAAFALLVDAQAHGVTWAAAGRVPPVDLPLRDDLRTRLGWGPVFALQPLPEEQARAVLRRESDRRGIVLGDEVMGYLLTRFQRDLSHLMALLDRLDGFALAEGRGVTVPLLKKMLADAEPPAP
ncbi:MAG: DnaA regulatory inactivator Hda [Ideonella sp.]|nr:DnaA regulatory inactivator Hda [Ideonella sp.]MCC7456605.1 DnaA regulatory inactivator Hda [Nitrospira sp.]